MNPKKRGSRRGFFLTVISVKASVEEGLDYILSHFVGQRLWPRTVSTKTTKNQQVIVNNREEALVRFKQSSFFDCRISAYPPPSSVSSFVGVNLDIAPSIVMIDLDRETFNTQKALDMALSKILIRIGQIGGCVQSPAARTLKSSKNEFQPTVIWSGNGYHIYLVLDAFVLETVDTFNNSRFGSNPSQRFLRFAEWFLTNGKCDLQHNDTVSLRNCMLRIPNTINSKNGQIVRIVQKWNGNQPSIKLFLEDFYVHLCHWRLVELKKGRCCKVYRQFVKSKCPNRGSGTICWIERLLSTAISDHRKLTVWRILAPYLINVKKLSATESFDIINQWLLKCNKLRKLDFNRSQKIKEGLKGAAKGYHPISLSRLKGELPTLYNHIQSLTIA